MLILQDQVSAQGHKVFVKRKKKILFEKFKVFFSKKG